MNITDNYNVINNNYKNKFVFFHHEHNHFVEMTIFYILQFLACVIGNCLELVILPRIKTPEDYITYALFCLACSDLLQALTLMPLNYIRDIYLDWFLGNFLCKFLHYISFVNSVTNVWISVYIAFDRYINICYPYRFIKLKNEKFCIFVLCCLFCVHSLLFSYILYFMHVSYSEKHNCDMCKAYAASEYMAFQKLAVYLVYSYALPVICLIIFYCSIIKTMLNHMTIKKFKCLIVNSEDDSCNLADFFVVKVILFLLIFFTTSNLLLFVARTWHYIDFAKGKPKSYALKKTFSIAKYFQTFHSCLNPWIYCFYSKKFLTELKQLFLCRENKRKFTHSSLFRNSSRINDNSRRLTLLSLNSTDNTDLE